MAIIQITKEWRITSDSRQWRIERRSVLKGKERWKSEMYFSDLAMAAQRLGNRMLRESDAEGVAEVLLTAENVCNTLRHALTPFFDAVSSRNLEWILTESLNTERRGVC